MSVNKLKKKKKKVVLAVSGGLDSAMAAFLLQKQGFELIGVYLRLNKNFQKSELQARLVCQRFGIKFYPINLVDKFENEIINYFIDSYKNGSTPNPCVKCNKFIKFAELLRIVDDFGADYLATGHYVQKIKNNNGFYEVHRPIDISKDQSYFLYNLKQKQLAKILFPLADYEKKDIRKLAEKEDIPCFKSESQDICFLLENGKIIDHNDFLKKKLVLKKGEIRNLEGKVLGRHQGLPLYTLGQRRGVEIGGTGPYYVAQMDYKKNILYVTDDVDNEILLKNKLIIKNVNWIRSDLEFPLNCLGVIRYQQKAVNCVVKKINDLEYKVEFEKSMRAVTTGQSAVFYNDNELLGGGVICGGV